MQLYFDRVERVEKSTRPIGTSGEIYETDWNEWRDLLD